MSREQIRKLGVGLVKMKDNKFDTEDEEDLEVVLGNGYVEEEKIGDEGLECWIDQEVLSHQVVSGLVSH
ncbi:hypothetical protein AQUCO_02600149v1 [Aquilegia coerulea]|uniref:Uncharacterized protein n=1 Tax=Aquilegia coerulea TaxID=218851 RepID=A0A2G5D7K9_AQUCA|nr:hypothetical protein AQUCO_02600149v1 [Aquilegia coerulea]